MSRIKKKKSLRKIRECCDGHEIKHVRIQRVVGINGSVVCQRYRCARCGMTLDVNKNVSLISNPFRIKELMLQTQQIIEEVDRVVS